MLLNGVNHVAIITNDAARLAAFYYEVFEAEVDGQMIDGGGQLTFIRLGESAELNVFQLPGNTEADRQTPMWGRGRIDHVGLAAASREAFEVIRDRLVESGASDGTVSDFGGALSIFFRDPDGLEGEVLLRKS